jgi:predicted ATPase
MGELLVEAACRGIYVVAETHSSLVLRAVQTAIARRIIPHSAVALNWFSRSANTGFSTIDVAEVDEFGRFGDWPVDFDEVVEKADWDFVESVQGASHD